MNDDTRALLVRIAEALERLAPAPAPTGDISADAYVYAEPRGLVPLEAVNRVPLELLIGIDRVKSALLENTRRFARGLPANNVLLWGARGMGKSSLVKAVHASVNAEGTRLAIVEIHREDINALPHLMNLLRASNRRIIIFCDDLSFDAGETAYKSLKAVLEGGLEGRPANVIFYATSNRRHLLPRDMIDNESGSAINPGDAVEEKVSLSDRFGLWLGIHKGSQDDYLAMVAQYGAYFGLVSAEGQPGTTTPDMLRAQALEWAATRGGRTGRIAWQFTQDLAGRLGRRLDRA